MKTNAYLFQRSTGIFYFRIVIPLKIRETYPYLPSEIRRSLKTRSKFKALELSRNIQVLVFEAFRDKRCMETLLEKIDHYLSTENGQLETNEYINDPIAMSSIRDNLLEVLIEIFQSGMIEHLEPDFSNISNILDDLSDINNAMDSANRNETKTNIINEINKHTAVISTPNSPIHNTNLSSKDNTDIFLSEAITKFIEDKRHDVRAKSLEQDLTTLERLQDFLGDVHLNSISQEIINKFFSNLRQYPTNKNKYKELVNLDFMNILKVSSDKNMSTLSNTTVLRNGRIINTFFTWCSDFNYIHENPTIVPFKHLKKKLKKKLTESSISYEPFTHEELQIIFSQQNYLKSVKWRMSRLWVPIIALYTGARQNEIASLTKEDIIKENGINCFNIQLTELNNRELKNSSSKRKIPVHKSLIDIGLIEYKKALPKHTHFLFPDIPNLDSNHSKGDALGKWWGRYLTQLGIKTNTKTFHSFRSTLLSKLRQNNVMESDLKDISGHTQNDVLFKIYAQNQTIDNLQNRIDSVDFDINISYFKNEWKKMLRKFKRESK